MKKVLRDYTVVLFILVIILLLIIRLPAGVVDIAIIIDMSLSMVILVTTMTVRKPLEFSIFPSLLLITTLFRLGINVSTTRNILTDRGASGLVVRAFGNFVLHGNVVVGLIILLIIILTQFIVITKGAERVAEITTRFNPDAIPGKQMAIDADLSSGLIDKQQAKRHREKIQREANFYDAIDGATEIVKGDVVMSPTTTAINLIGDSIIGYIQSGDSIGNVLSIYFIATVGDGLVGQIPTLLVSTATDMVVTRMVSEGSLNEDASGQSLAQPQAIMIGGVAIVVLAVIPGMPVIQLALTSAGLLSGGYYPTKRIKKESSLIAESTYQDVEAVIPGRVAHQKATISGNAAEEYYKDINNVYTLLTVGPVEMEFGCSLIPLVDESVGGRLISRIVIFRRQYTQNMGFVIPSIRLKDNSGLSTNQYCIKIKGEGVARGEIPVDYYLALESGQLGREVDRIETVEPAYRVPSRWIRSEDRERVELYGYTVVDPLSVMVTHLSEVIKQHVYELMIRREVIHFVGSIKRTTPELVEEALPNLVSYNLFQRILTSLLKEGVSIEDLETIIETMIEVISETGLPVKGTDSIVEYTRTALKRTITRMYCEDGTMKVIALDSGLERIMVGSLSKGEEGYYLALSPDILQSIVGQMAEQLRKFDGLAQSPVVLASQVMWVHFHRLVEQFYLKMRVPSFNGITNNVQIQSIGGPYLEAPAGWRV